MFSIGGTTGSIFTFQSPPILSTPWNWNFPELKIINLNTGKEEYILKPNQNYEVRVNITNSSGYPISSGITVSFSFTHMYGTDGVKGGYENPILLDGSTSFILWSDRTFNLNYNSTGGYWYRDFTTPSQWKYDGHLTHLRLRITNNTNSTFRIRYATSDIQIPVYTVIFSNTFYSGSGIDVIAKDIDFGTSSNHPFYTASGGAPPTFNDGNNDLWVEDSRKIILIYNTTPGTVAQVPIIWYDKLTGLVHYSAGSTWAPGFSYLGTYKQTRNVRADLGLSRDYSAILLQESNSLGYNYNVTLYIPANSDYMDVFYDLPDIYTLDFIWQTFAMRAWGNMRYFNVTRIYLETLFGKEEVFHIFRPFTTTGVTNVGGWAFSNVTAKAPSYYLGFTTSLPMPTTDGLTPCYPYCFQYTYTEFMYGFNISRNNDNDFYNNWRFVFGILVTEGLDEYRSETQTWSNFNFNNGQLPNFNLRKVRARFILGNLVGPPDNGTMLLTENKTWRYGYPTSYTGSSIDIYFNKISRSYSVGENVLIFLKARNYTTILPQQTLNIYILDDSGNIVYQTQQITDNNGMVSISFTPAKTGVYRVRAVGNGLFGIGFFWVRKVQQAISLDKSVYQPGDTVNIKDFVYDSATGSAITASVNCYAYNQMNENVWGGSLTKVGNYYQGSFIISPTSSTGVWKLTCAANDGSSTDASSINFPVSKATSPEKQIQSVELSVPAYVLTNTNFTVEVFVRNMGNSLVDCDNVTLSVIDGLRNVQIYNNLNMSWRETGKYYSILNVSNESVYLLRATCNINNLTYLSNPAITTSQRQITEQSIWSYSNRTLTNYNQTDILSKLSDVNSTVYTIKKMVDCSLPSNSILCSYLDNINNTVSYIKQNMATYSQIQGLISDVSWLKANVATQDAVANNFTMVKNMLSNMNTTLVGIANNLTNVNQTLAQKIDDVRSDVVWIMNNVATKTEIASNFSTTFSKLDKINSTLYEVRDYLYNDITSKLNYINTTQITYFPIWNSTFYYWNGSYFAIWNGSIMNLNNNWNNLWLYWNCSNQNNTVCDYLKLINTSIGNIPSNVWNYPVRTLTDYNQTEILSRLSEINATTYLIKKMVDCSSPSNSVLCSYLNSINTTINYINQTMATYSQVQSLINDVGWLKANIATQDAMANNFTLVRSMLSNMNSTIVDVRDKLLNTNQTLAQKIDLVQADVIWIMNNIATSEEITSNFSATFNRLDRINSTLYDVKAYLMNDVMNKLNSIEQIQLTYFPEWNTTFYFWNNSYFVNWNGSVIDLSNNWKKLWLYWNCSSENNTVCDYLIEAIAKLNYINSTQFAYFPEWDVIFYYWNNSYFVSWNGSIMNLNNNWNKLWNYWKCGEENNTVCNYLREIITRNASVDYNEISEYVWNASEAQKLIEIVEKIWNVTQPTNQSVVTGEVIENSVLSSTQSIVYKVNISVPGKEGYKIGDWVPIKINFWFVNDSECVSQSTSNTINPYCEPLTAVFLAKIGSNVIQTITMRPINLEPGKVYKVIREVSIDPNERWIVYGRGEIGSIYVLERNQEKKVIINTTYSFGGVSNTYQNQIYNRENSVEKLDMLKLIVSVVMVIVIVFLAYKTKKEELLALMFLTFLFAPVIGAQEIGTVNYIDDIPPNITVISPEPKTYDRAFIDLIYVVSDNVAVDKCWYELNGNISDLPWCNNKTLNLPSGHYDLKVYVNDTSGNTVNYRVVFDVSIGGTPYYGVGLMNFYISLNITPSTQYLEIYKYGKLVFNKTITKGEIISLVPGTYTFVFSAEGYKTKKVDLNVTRSFILTVKLEEQKTFSQTSILDQIKENLTPNRLVDLSIISLVIIFLYLVLKDKLVH